MTLHLGIIQKYKIVLTNPPSSNERKIYLYGSFGTAILYFIPDDGQLGNSRKRSGANIFDVYYYFRSWDSIVDTLRNEKPVTFKFNDTNNHTEIFTHKEEVGEEET